MTSMDGDEARVRALLGLGRRPAEPVDPDPPARAVSAEAARAFRFEANGVVATVYSFFDGAELGAGEAELLRLRAGVRVSQNGSLLLAVEDADAASAEFVEELLGDFAGRE